MQRCASWAMTLPSISRWFTVPWWLLASAALAPAVVCATFIVDKAVRHQVRSEADLRLFSIQNAICAVEGDRAIVEGNGVSLMRNPRLAPADSTHAVALLTFDRLVQTTMPRAVRDAVGRAGMRYELLVVMLAPVVFYSFDVVGAEVFAGKGFLTRGHHDARFRHIHTCILASWRRAGHTVVYPVLSPQWLE